MIPENATKIGPAACRLAAAAVKLSGGPSWPPGADAPGLGAPFGPFPPPSTPVGAVGRGPVGVEEVDEFEELPPAVFAGWIVVETRVPFTFVRVTIGDADAVGEEAAEPLFVMVSVVV